MEQKNRIYTVQQIGGYLRNMFEQDFLLNRVSVRGEVSNAKDHPSGHLYFTLKDGNAQLSVVMFSGNRLRGLKCRLKDGMQAVVSGQISVYEGGGRYQMYAREITDDGEGALYRRFLELKNRLEEMGMFDAAYKKPIPHFVRTVGIVTSESGAALRDIVSIAGRRNPYVQLILSPALVQGEQAPASIAEAIRRMDRLHPDVMIVGRGGGSQEDLFCFNDERVARAIFEADTPIISAVGHETDFTIADFTADLRAATPSAAAELAVFDYYAVKLQLDSSLTRLTRSMYVKEELLYTQLKKLENGLKAVHPAIRLRENGLRLIEMENRMKAAAERIFSAYSHRIALAAGRLNALSPSARLKGGFAFMTYRGMPVRSVRELKAGEKIRLTMTDGRVDAEVKDIEYDGPLGGV